MKTSLLLFAGLSVLAACGQDYNSNSGDEIYGKAEEPVSGSPLFQEAFGIIRTRCVPCHRGSHAEWNAYRTEEDWKRAKLVVPGDKKASPIIKELSNEGGDMPLGERPLSASEHETLVRWVEEMP